MLHFEGDTDFTQAPAVVWAKLSDARFVVQCIPGVESVSKDEASEVVCVLRPGFSFVRSTLEIALRVVEAVPDTSLRVIAHAKSIGATNDVETFLTFGSHDGGTRVHWTADIVNLTGLLKMVPRGLLQGAAQKVIADVWAQVQAKLT
jgi:carbon monoxide dehydrogenase subunit G